MFIYPFISLWITSSDSSCFIHLQYHKPIYIFIKAQTYLSIHHIYYIYLSPHKLLQFRTLRSDCTQRPHQRLAAGVLKRGWRRARGLCWAAEARWRGRAGGARRVETAPLPPHPRPLRRSRFPLLYYSAGSGVCLFALSFAFFRFASAAVSVCSLMFLFPLPVCLFSLPVCLSVCLYDCQCVSVCLSLSHFVFSHSLSLHPFSLTRSRFLTEEPFSPSLLCPALPCRTWT